MVIQKNCFRIGEWEVEPLSGTISGPDGEVRLQPKTMDVLVHLAEHAGTVVTREAILLAVWGERAVSDEPLTRCIADLRKALGDDSAAPRFIETIPKRGYRLMPLLTDVTSAPVSGSEQSLKKRSVIFILATLGFTVLFLGAILAWQILRSSSLDIPRIAVLPLTDNNKDVVDKYFTNGLTEYLIGQLERVDVWQVISQNEVALHQRESLSLSDLAEKLNADFVLQGDLTRIPVLTSINFRLFSASESKILWTRQFDDNPTEVTLLLHAASNEIVKQLAEQITGFKEMTLANVNRLPRQASTYELFLQAKSLARTRNAENMHRSIALLKAAETQEPAFAPVLAELSLNYFLLMKFSGVSASEMQKQATDYALRSISLDSSLGRPHHVLALMHTDQTKWIDAEREFQTALQRNPKDALIHVHYARFLELVGKLQAAKQRAEYARSIDPAMIAALTRLAETHMALGEYDALRSQVSTLQLLGYEQNNFYLYQYYVNKGDYENAKAYLPLAIAEYKDAPNFDLEPFFRYLETGTGRQQAIATVYEMSDSIFVPDDLQVRWFLDLGMPDRAIAAIVPSNEYVASRGLHFVWHPRESALRQLPRFKEILHEFDLVNYWRQNGWPDLCRPLGSDDFECD